MINVADDNKVYYYHFDGLGSVIALSDSAGNTVQTYEYTVWGEVAAEDVNHPNPIMFTGRWFDKETGLYYYRARYYNPYIGRFLQTDPVVYGYSYCHNNPLGWVDPSGLSETYVPYAYLWDPGDSSLWYLENIAEPEYNVHWTDWGMANPTFFNIAVEGIVHTTSNINGIPFIYLDRSVGPWVAIYLGDSQLSAMGISTLVTDQDLISTAEAIFSAATSEPAEPASTPERTPTHSSIPTWISILRDTPLFMLARGRYPLRPGYPTDLPPDRLAKWIKAWEEGFGERAGGFPPSAPKGRLAAFMWAMARLMHMYKPVVPVIPDYYKYFVPDQHGRPSGCTCPHRPCPVHDRING